MKFIAAMIASLLDRAFGTKPSVLLTIAGIVGALAAGLAALPASILPAEYQPYLVGAAGFLALLAGALGYGHNPTPNRVQSPSTPNVKAN